MSHNIKHQLNRNLNTGLGDGFVEPVFMLGFEVGVDTEAEVRFWEGDFSINLFITILYSQQI